MVSCASASTDGGSLVSRVTSFLSDRSASAVTGPRRYGRGELVILVRETAESIGLNVWGPEGGDGDPDVIILDHWSELEDSRELISEHPEADVLYGQDLCHQVPAVVRLSP